MVKRISCRVVSSVPLVKSGVGAGRVDRLDDKPGNARDVAAHYAGRSSSPAGYPGRSVHAMGLVEAGFPGQMLDFYA